MFYLADFKRKYEKWLNAQPDNKKIYIPTLNTDNKYRTVKEIKTIVQNARKTNLKKGRNKKTKTYVDTLDRLKRYTGKTEDFNINPERLARQQEIKSRGEATKQKYLNKKKTRPFVTLNSKPEIEKPVEQIIQKIPEVKSDLKTSVISDKTQGAIKRNITVKETVKGFDRKLGLGLLGSALVLGGGLAVYRKTRSDKGRKRGNYRRD